MRVISEEVIREEENIKEIIEEVIRDKRSGYKRRYRSGYKREEKSKSYRDEIGGQFVPDKQVSRTSIRDLYSSIEGTKRRNIFTRSSSVPLDTYTEAEIARTVDTCALAGSPYDGEVQATSFCDGIIH